MRQSTEAFGKISHMFYVKASATPETVERPPLQSRDFTALAGQANVPDNLGNPYPCQPVDLDAPVPRDAWYDANKATIEKQVKTIGGQTSSLEKECDLTVGFGWSTEKLDVSVDAVWEALTVNVRNPEKFMEVTDVSVCDKEGYMLRTMTITKNTGEKTTVKEHIIINREASEIVYQPMNIETDKPSHQERVIAIKEEPFLHLEYYQRELTDGMRSSWTAPVSALRTKVDKLIKVAKQLDGTTEPIIGFGLHSPELADVDHDALWTAMQREVLRPRIIMPKCIGIARDGCVERQILKQRAYVSEHLCEVAFRDVIDGKEVDIELAVILRAHPLELEVCERNIRSGFRVHSTMLKEEASTMIDGLVAAARGAMKNQSTTVGLGITSAPIHCASYDSLFAGIERTIRKPWLIMGVDESSFEGKDQMGFYERRMKIKATGKTITDHVTVNEEAGEIIYTEPGCMEERVCMIHKQPLRIEIFRRNKVDKVRCEWDLPRKAGLESMSKMVDFAKAVEESQTNTVGFGIHSAPLNFPESAVWKAMILCALKPDQCGMKVDQVDVKDMNGYALRTQRIIASNRVRTDTIRLKEDSKEILIRAVENGVESDIEGVMALRSDPLRVELHSRSAKNEMRIKLNQPAAAGQDLLECIKQTAPKAMAW